MVAGGRTRTPSTLSAAQSRADQILAAARGSFAEHGYDGASIADIARRVGVAEGAIYRHFASKRELLHHVIRAFYEPLIESARQAVAGIADPRDRLRFLVWRQLQAMTEDRLVCRLVISEARSLHDYYQSEVADLSRAYTNLATEAVHDGVRLGLFRDDLPVALVRDVIYGGIEHVAWAALTGRDALDVDRCTDELLSLLLGGLAVAPPAPTPRPPAPGGTRPDRPDDDRLTRQLDRLDAVTHRLERLAPADHHCPEGP